MEAKQNLMALWLHAASLNFVRASTHSSTYGMVIARAFPQGPMNRIRDFLYRSPRFTTQLRMDFIHGDSVFLGTCTNLSESGLRGTFSEVVPAGVEGLITLYYQDRPFQMRAKVYSIRDGEARVRFLWASDKERTAMAELIKLHAPRVRS